MAISAGKLMNVSDKKKTQSQPKAALVPTKGSQYAVGSQPDGADGSDGGDSGTGEDELLNNLIIIKEKTVSIDEHLRNVYKVQKKDIRDIRYEAVKEKKRNALGLMQKSAKDAKEAAGKKKGGFFSKEVDAVKNYALNIFLGFIALKLVPLLPNIIKFIAKAGPVFEWIEKTAGFLLNMIVSFIDLGYKAVDGVKGVVTKIFGEGGAQTFDKFTGIFTKFMNLAMILMMATSDMGGNKPPKAKGQGKKPKWKKKIGNKFKKTRIGKKLRNIKARKIKVMRKFGKGLKGLKRGAGKFFGKQVGRFNKFVGKGVKGALGFGRRFIGKGAGAAKGLAGKAAGKIGGFAVKIFGKAAKFIAPAMKSAKPFVSKFFGKIPIIGPIVVGLVSVISGEPLGKALFKTLGAALGGALGTFIPIPVLGTLIGETIGVFVGDLLYEGLMGIGWGAAGKKLFGSLKKIFSAGKAVAKWLGGGIKRYVENFLKDTAIEIPEGGGRHSAMTLVAKTLGLYNWLKGLGYVNAEGRVSKFPNLLQLMNPFKTIPIAIKSFFPPGEKKEGGDIGVSSGGGGGGDYNLMDEVDESKGEKKKTKLEKKNEEIAELKKKLKEVEKSKIKEIVFKVNRVGEIAADTEAISETPGYDKSGKVKVIAMTKIKNTVVGMPQGGNTNIDIPTSGNTESGMEAALS